MSATLAGLTLAGARIWACLRVQASWRRAIGSSWEWIAAALGLLVAGLALVRGARPASALADGWSGFVLALAFELGLGSVIGLLASLPGWALVGAADESAAGLGLRADSGLSRLLVVASLAAGLSLGLHAPLCASLVGSFDVFALAQPQRWLPAMASPGAIIEGCVRLTVLALALATPVLLSQALVSLCVGSLARGRDAMRGLIAVLGPGLRLAVGLVALGAAWSAYPEAFARGL